MDSTKITCDGCGVCCSNIGKPPFLHFEVERLPDNLKREWNASEAIDGPCIWFENGKCKNYEHRPFVCEDFEVGSESCIEYRKLYDIG